MSELELYKDNLEMEKEKLYLTLRKTEGEIRLLLVNKFGTVEKILARFKEGELEFLNNARPTDFYDYGDLKFTPNGILRIRHYI